MTSLMYIDKMYLSRGKHRINSFKSWTYRHVSHSEHHWIYVCLKVHIKRIGYQVPYHQLTFSDSVII
jgi:hypothetical protein